MVAQIVSPQGPPNLQVPIATAPAMTVSPVWMQFFVSLTARPPAAMAVTPDASPFVYTASQGGNLLVVGGTVSQIQLTRGRTTVDIGATSGFVPLSQGDVATIIYSGAPIITFLAR